MYLHWGWGSGRPASVDRDDLPQPYSELGSDYSSFLLLGLFTLVNIIYIYCLITLVTWVTHAKLGLI